MELQELQPFVVMLILVGLLIGVGVLTLDKFGDATYYSTTITNESFTAPAQDGTVSLAKTGMLSVSEVNNGTDVLDSSNYTVALDTGVLTLNDNTTGCPTAGTCYATYVYKDYNTKTATAVDSARDEVSNVTTTWLGILITIVIMALILTAVIRSFSARR
jgi:hypothetical protein